MKYQRIYTMIPAKDIYTTYIDDDLMWVFDHNGNFNIIKVKERTVRKLNDWARPNV